MTVSNDPGGQFPYSTSPERIEFLAKARNKAMLPIQSPDASIRLPNWKQYSRIIFLNDIVFEWRDIVRLIATRVEGKEDEDYDVACAMDFGRYGEHLGVYRSLTAIRFLRYLGHQRYLRYSLPRAMAICRRQAVSESGPRSEAIPSDVVLERSCRLQL